jgi:hypothetical protein
MNERNCPFIIAIPESHGGFGDTLDEIEARQLRRSPVPRAVIRM